MRGRAAGLGATPTADGRCSFLVWAPNAGVVEVVLGCEPATRAERTAAAELGYHRVILDGVRPGDRYRYRLDGGPDRPDPASRSQPEGVHGPSEVIDPRGFEWTDQGWSSPPLAAYVIYELHVGTFSPEGTFDAVLPHLDALAELGITAVELMPVAQFPGERNWGYDGVFPWAVQYSYGGPDGLRRLVDACHRRGLAVALDVVYNHLGPEGNVLPSFGPYFTDRYRTPWGQAVNVDGPGSDEVRRYLVANAEHWFAEYHLDALRLDAVHGIVDTSARPFLRELAEATHALSARMGRPLYLIAESDLGDPRVVARPEAGGLGMDAQWADDLHHSVHALLTGERDGYYADFGEVDDLARALRDGFAFTGQRSAYRGRRHGAPTTGIPAERFVVSVQNHDQVGNRMLGERLSALVGFEDLKLAAGLLLLSPFVPLLFMGQEYGETAPFLYFVSHSDPELVEGVRAGRREEFAAFGWRGEAPDPQDEDTFVRSRLDHGLANRGRHAVLRRLYGELLRLRREVPSLAHLSRDDLAVDRPADDVLVLRRWTRQDEAAAAFNTGRERTVVPSPEAPTPWAVLLDSADRRWDGPRDGEPSAAAEELPAAAAGGPPGAAEEETVEAVGGEPIEVEARSFVLLHRTREVWEP